MVKRPTIKRWVLSPHAAQRMSERDISVDDLQRLIDSPDTVVHQGPKWIFAGHLPGRTDNQVAAVILEKGEKGLWLVITVMVRFAGRK